MNQLDSLLNQSIGLFIAIPLIAFFATLFWQNKQERPIILIVQFTKAFYIIAALAYAIIWIINGADPVSQRLVTLYESQDFVFAIQFYYDRVTAVFSVTAAVLFFLVATFSRYYMHRDEGYKRFFNTILFFAVGFNVIIFSGNFETLFIGWEIIGMSSFLLIAYFRERYMPVKNAFKTLSYYRVSDLAIILAMWMMHHLMHQNISFTDLTEAKMMSNSHHSMAVFIGIMFVLAAMIKSAQFPFTAWLPRAMEGPTSSSAIFYGSLSVHIGVFLLLRTYPFWDDMLWMKIVIISVGALTGVIATLIARAQPTVKTQIAYSSAAQIGLIFIEVALGWHTLALVHFAGNAFLRTYQLLVSPSVLNYLVHHQYFHHKPKESKPVSGLTAGLYVLSIKEWNLDTMMSKYLWSPFKWIGKQFQFLQSAAAIAIMVIIGIVAVYSSISRPSLVEGFVDVAPTVLLSVALLLILSSFSQRRSALRTWMILFVAQLFILAGFCFNAAIIGENEIILYASGVVPAFLLGYYCLSKIKRIDNDVELNKYHGYVYEQKTTALLFLISAMGLVAFPVTAAFVGMDVLFIYIGSGQSVLIGLLALCFIFIELAAIRIYCRIFLGPHKKLDHPVAFRSS